MPFKSSPIFLSAVSLLHAGSALAQTTYEQRHDAFYDDLSGRNINLGQTDGPHRAGRTGFWTTQGKLQRGNTSSGCAKTFALLGRAFAEATLGMMKR